MPGILSDKKFGFWISGGQEIGLGHVMRSLAIAELIRSKGGVCRFIQSDFDQAVRRLIRSHGFIYSCLTHSSNIGWKGYDHPTWLVDVPNHMSNIIKLLRTQWPKAKIASLDHHESGKYYPDTIINLRPGPENSSLRPRFVNYHEGFQFAIIRDEFKPYRHIVKTDTEPMNILVCFGSSDIGRNTEKVLSSIILNPIPNIVLHLIIGPNALHSDSLIKLASTSPVPIRVYNQPLNIPKVMSHCDIALCGGGTTMLELAYLGIPSIIIGQTKDEENLALLLEQRGVGISAGNAKTYNVIDIQHSCRSLLRQPAKLKTMRTNSQNLIDGNGLERIADIMGSLAILDQ